MTQINSLLKKKRKYLQGGNRRGKDPVNHIRLLLRKENGRDWDEEKQTMIRYQALLNEKKRALRKEMKEIETAIESSESAEETGLDEKIAVLTQQQSDLESAIEDLSGERGTHSATPPLTPELFSFMLEQGINNVVDATFITAIGRNFKLVDNPGRGHCGYYALRDMLRKIGGFGIQKTTSAYDLRKMVWDMFMDDKRAAYSIVYRMVEGGMEYSDEIFSDMVKCIWNDETNWKTSVKEQYHMDFQHDIPVICAKLGLNIMVYDLNVNQTFFYSPTQSHNIERLEPNFIFGEVESVHRMLRYNDHYRYIEEL